MKRAMNKILSHSCVCVVSFFAGVCAVLHYTAEKEPRNHAGTGKAGQNQVSEAPFQNMPTERQDGQQGKITPVEISLEQEIEIMNMGRTDLLKAIEDPDIYEGFLTQEKRAIIKQYATFLSNQALNPEQKKRFVDTLAEQKMLELHASNQVFVSAPLPAMDKAALDAVLSLRRAVIAEIEGEFSGKITAILGDELTARYQDFTKSEKLWKEMDKFSLNMDPTAPLFSDEQKIQIVDLLKTSETKTIMELGGGDRWDSLVRANGGIPTLRS
jgi:hypothetical protein